MKLFSRTRGASPSRPLRHARIVRLAAALLSAAMLLTLAGCNRASSATDCVERFQTAMNKEDFREAFAYIADYDGFGFKSDGSEDIIAAVARTLTIDVLSETPVTGGANLEVNITTIDLREAYCDAANVVIPTYYKMAVSGQPISEAELGRKLVDEVTAQAASGRSKGVSTRCNLFVRKNNRDKWEIVLDTTSFSALTGYLDEANNLITTGAIANKVYGVEIEGLTASDSDASPSDAQ